MATSIQQITEFLDQDNIKYRVSKDGNFVSVIFNTATYKNVEGESCLSILINLDEDGDFIKIMVPKAYVCPTDMTSFNRMSVFQVLLHISWMTKMLQFEFDPDDGEIRMVIEFPVEDSTLTQRQLSRCIHTLVTAGEKYHENITDALNHGIKIESESETRKMFEEFLRQRRAQRRQGFPDMQ